MCVTCTKILRTRARARARTHTHTHEALAVHLVSGEAAMSLKDALHIHKRHGVFDAS